MKEGAIGRLQTAMTALAVMTLMGFVTPLAATAAQLGVLRGNVRDSRGMPVGGALVVATPTAAFGSGRVASEFTNSRGSFVIPNLAAGQYDVKVTMPWFLPATRTIQLNGGTTADLSVSLQTASGLIPQVRTRDVADDQNNIVWILRGNRSGQPPLRFAPGPDTTESLFRAAGDYAGSLQIYSASVETADGVIEGVGSQFSVTTNMTPRAKVTFRGRFSELPTETNAFEAAVELRTAGNRKSHIGVSVRQGGFGGALQAVDVARELRVQYGDSYQWSRRLAIEYGAQVGAIEAYNGRNYVRPRFALAWSANPRTKIRVGVTSQAPAVYDAMGGKNGLDGGAYEPYAASQRFHGEIVLARLSENTTITATAFGDRAEAQSLFAGSRLERRLIVFEGRPVTTSGARIELNRDYRDFSAGVSYTNATGIGLSHPVRSFDDLLNHLTIQRFHIVTGRFHTIVPMTSTEVTAVYRWMPHVSAVPVDPYQTFSESNEPTLSVMVAQELPTLRPFGGRVQAVVDARNLLEPSLSGRRIQLAQSPRLVKGGLNIQF